MDTLLLCHCEMKVGKMRPLCPVQYDFGSVLSQKLTKSQEEVWQFFFKYNRRFSYGHFFGLLEEYF